MNDRPWDENDEADEDASSDAGGEDDDREWNPDITGGVRIIGATEVTGPDERPVLRFPSGPPAESLAPPPIWADDTSTEDVTIAPVNPDETFELLHYSDPPTGQVPKVVIGDGESGDSWLAGQPRWRDENDASGLDGDFSDIADPDGERLGALSDSDSADLFDGELDLSGGPSLVGAAASIGATSDPEDGPPRSLRRQPRRMTSLKVDPEAEATAHAGASGGRNLPLAIGVGVALLAIGLLCFKIGTIATAALIAVVLSLAAAEYFTTVRRAGYNPATLLGVVAVMALAVAPVAEPTIAYPVVLAMVVMSSLLWFFWVSPGDGVVMNLGVTLLGIAWIGGLGSLGALLLGQGRLIESTLKGGDASNPGIGVIIAAMLVTIAYDVGGYFIGQAVGRTPLSAASPNKTTEGLYGGISVAIVVPLAILFLFGISPVGDNFFKALVFCVFCAVAAPLGDLCQSAIKRDLGVKDMGTLLPGHGGVLDRFDAFLFVLPTAWCMAHILQLANGGF